MKKSPERIPIKVAKEIGDRFKCDQVLVFAWNRETDRQHIVTWGRTTVDCDQIAQGGNYIKEKLLSWPENECCAEPNRVKQLKARIKELEEKG